MSDVATLHQGLNRMAPRSMQVLLRRFVEQRSRDQLATLYGLTLEQADLLVWRAARSFEAALAGHGEPGPLPLVEELEQAQRLAENPSPALVAISELREPLQQALDRAAEEAEASPARAQEEWLRRVAIALVLAVAGYFYWRENYGPKERKPPEPRPAPVHKTAP